MRFERLDLNLLVALDALIEDRNVSMAARRLYLSQPALTGALNRLRDFFGDDLLIPSGRQMMLTPKAEELRGPVSNQKVLKLSSTLPIPIARRHGPMPDCHPDKSSGLARRHSHQVPRSAASERVSCASSGSI